jgi:hypothetical protein
MTEEFKTLRSLLEFHVQQLRLKPDACWPSEAAETKEMIRAYQRAQQPVDLHDVKDCDGSHHSGE